MAVLPYRDVHGTSDGQVSVYQLVITWPTEYDVEVHAVDANVGVVLNTQVNVLLDAEAEVPRRTEVTFSQLVLSHLQQQHTRLQ